MHERSLGSGVIVDPKGYIITNEHVVDRADRVRVQLQNDPPGTLRDAKVIGVDKETDLAVIKIDAKEPLPAAKLGNSDSANVGDWVLADWEPVRIAVHCDCRHRLGERPRHRSAAPVPVVHPD